MYQKVISHDTKQNTLEYIDLYIQGKTIFKDKMFKLVKFYSSLAYIDLFQVFQVYFTLNGKSHPSDWMCKM